MKLIIKDLKDSYILDMDKLKIATGSFYFTSITSCE